LRFASLASGSSGNCLVAEADGTVLLVDCGLALTETERRLQRLGLEPSQVSGILITHEHGDHACGAFEFAAAHRVTVYLTHGTAAALKAEGKVLDGVPLCLVNGRQAFFIDGLQLVPFTVPHDARQLLRLKGRGRLTEIDAEKRIQQALERMRERKEIKAPKTPNADWALIGHDPKATES